MKIISKSLKTSKTKCLKKFIESNLSPSQEYYKFIEKMKPLEIIDFSIELDNELTNSFIKNVKRNYFKNGPPHTYHVNEKLEYIDNYGLADLTLSALWIDDRISNLHGMAKVISNNIFLYEKVIEGKIQILKQKTIISHFDTFTILEIYRHDKFLKIKQLFLKIGKIIIKSNNKKFLEGDNEKFVDLFSNKTISSTKKPTIICNATLKDFSYLFILIFNYIVLEPSNKKRNTTKYDILNAYFVVNGKNLYNENSGYQTIRKVFSEIKIQIKDAGTNKHIMPKLFCPLQKEIDNVFKELKILL